MANAISNIVKPPAYAPSAPQMGGIPAQTALSNAIGGFARPTPPMPLFPPTAQKVKSHVIKHPDGTSITQTYHNPDEQKDGLVNPKKIGEQKPSQSNAATFPEIKMIDNLHHVPYQKADGSFGFIDAQGNTH